MERSILLAGATGAVGHQFLKCLLQDDGYKHIILLTRRTIELPTPDARVTQHIVDFAKLEEHRDLLKAQDIFCGLGSTRKKAGSREAFYEIDHDYPLALAKIAKENGAKRFFLISSLGAKARSFNHYLHTKGQLEEDLLQLHFDSTIILRPSLLLGERNESRPGEALGVFFDKAFRWAVPKRYRGIQTTTIAQRVLALARTETQGVQILESEQI